MANVELSDDLIKDLEQIVNDSNEFTNVSAYVEYILKQVVEKKKRTQSTHQEQDATYSKEDEDKIRERLKNLGYLD